MVKNVQLTRENSKLGAAAEKYKSDFIHSSSLNLKYKTELENTITDRDNISTALQRQKRKFVE